MKAMESSILEANDLSEILTVIKIKHAKRDISKDKASDLLSNGDQSRSMSGSPSRLNNFIRSEPLSENTSMILMKSPP